MKILLVRPLEKPVVTEIEDTLENLQKIVGGYIEIVPFFDDGSLFVCNEEGKLLHLPLNRAITDEDGNMMDIIAGTFFICNSDEYGNLTSLSDQLIEKYSKRFQYPEIYF